MLKHIGHVRVDSNRIEGIEESNDQAIIKD